MITSKLLSRIFCVLLESINTSHITIFSKIDNPSSPGDFRLISLLNSVLKIITKLLANRLQNIILKLVHNNQYGFLKERSIEDCLGWAFEYLYQGHKPKEEILVPKLDFGKAFYKIEHTTILEIFKAKGFGEKWISWIKVILSAGTSAILLNGITGKKFYILQKGCQTRESSLPTSFCIGCWFSTVNSQ